MLAYLLSHHGFNIKWKSIAYLGSGQKCVRLPLGTPRSGSYLYIYCVFLICDFSVLPALKSSNEKQYSLARRTLNS
jgi:hypothetical protein